MSYPATVIPADRAPPSARQRRPAARPLRTWGWPVGGLALLLLGLAGAPGKPQGTMTWALHVTVAPTWFDPAEASGVITPLLFLYTLHDAPVKPMPGDLMGMSLAESRQMSPDGLVYRFKLREGLRFHNGDPFTAEDVQFSFERYRGAASKELHDKVQAVRVVGPHRVEFHLAAPWPDFMAFCGSPASGAAWIVPQKYLQTVGDEGFKRHPVGLGPYQFVSHTPGVELVLSAFEGYWRKVPHVQRLIYFVDPWDATSPWRDARVRLAANHALDRQALNEAETLGYSRLTGSIVPHTFPFALPLEPLPYDPAKAKQLLKEAGYPQGFDAGDIIPVPPWTAMAEAVAGYLGAVGIKVRVRGMERPTMFAAWRAKTLQGVILAASGALGSASTRLENYVVSWGEFAYGGYPDPDELFRQQARERDPKRREALLHELQRLVYERAMFAPIYEIAGLNGVGPRVAESGLGLIPTYNWSGPYEDVRLKR